MTATTGTGTADLPEMYFTLQRPFPAYPLLSKTTLTEPDESRGILPVRRFVFGYPDGKALNFTFTSQVLKVVRRDTMAHKSYSPTSEASQQGRFELTVKIYPGGGHSAWLDAQPIGTLVEAFGPVPPPGRDKVYTPGKRLVAVALGIGVTEAFTSCREELRKSDDNTARLLFSMRYADELVLQPELDALKKEAGGRFQVSYITTRENTQKEGWVSGRVGAAMVQKAMAEPVNGTPLPKEDVKVLVVGTKPMMRAVWEDLESNAGLEYERYTLVRKRAPPYF